MSQAAESTGAGTTTGPGPKPIAHVPNRPGRPRKGEDRTPIPVLPRPPSFKGIRVPAFIDYWRTIDAKFPARLVVYVYRQWPVTDRVRCNLAKYLDVLAVGSTIATDDIADTDQFETFMFHRFGSGDYKLILNDGAISREVCQVFAKYRDADILPLIDPLASLVVEDPINKPFIEALTRKGVKIPGTYNEIEEDDMARVTTEALTGTVERLVDKTLEMADRAAEAGAQREVDQQARDRDRPASGDAISSAVSGLSAAWRVGNDMVKAAVDTASRANSANPVETMKGLVEMARSMVPPAPAADPSGGLTNLLITKLMERESTASAAATEAMTAQNQFLRELILGRSQGASPLLPNMPGGSESGMGLAPVAGMTAAGPAQTKSFLDSIRELSQAKDELQNLLGIAGTGGDGAAGEGAINPRATGFWDRYGPMLLNLGVTIATGLYNATVARSGAGAPIDLAGQLNPAPAPDNSPPLPPPTPSPASIAGTDPALAPYHAFLATLKEPLIQSLNNGETGDEFAEKLAKWQGFTAYNYLREMGSDRLLAMLSTYPPIWEYVSKIPSQFQAFLDEFLSYGAPESEPEPPNPAHNARANPALASGAPRERPSSANPVPIQTTIPAAVAAHKSRSAPRPTGNPDQARAARQDPLAGIVRQNRPAKESVPKVTIT